MALLARQCGVLGAAQPPSLWPAPPRLLPLRRPVRPWRHQQLQQLWQQQQHWQRLYPQAVPLEAFRR